MGRLPHEYKPEAGGGVRMTSKYEKVTVTVTRDEYHYEYTCDTCGQAAPGRAAASPPANWYGLTRWTEGGQYPSFLYQHYCSLDCLRPGVAALNA